MKYLILLIIFPLLFACKGNHKKPDPKFIGSWQLPVVDAETKEVIDQMKMTFTSEGTIIYEVKGPSTNEKGENMEQSSYTETYYTEDGYLFSKPEGAKEDKAKYEFKTNDELLLYFDGTIQTLTRIK